MDSKEKKTRVIRNPYMVLALKKKTRSQESSDKSQSKKEPKKSIFGLF